MKPKMAGGQHAATPVRSRRVRLFTARVATLYLLMEPLKLLDEQSSPAYF
jgi:hypothetical protein